MIDDATESAYVKAIETMFSGLPVAEGMNAFAASLDAVVPVGLRTSLEKLGSLGHQSIFNNWLTEQLAAHPVGVDVMWFLLSDLGDDVSLCLLRQRRLPQDDHDWDAYERIATSDAPPTVLRPLNDLIDATTSADTELFGEHEMDSSDLYSTRLVRSDGRRRNETTIERDAAWYRRTSSRCGVLRRR